ncbi:LacI family DNA-binding transcriptional regulator [Buttiauxella sp.]|uniref:LacI family DNA-binding transcriptional regulator n=1 Tax=Buttiauxella sp. TaxID=1972222 RepID=UPI003C792149
MKTNSKRITIQDVAAKTGYAAMTISRVINTPHLVANKTRKHVEFALSELGYVKNNIASCLASSKEVFCFVLLDSELEIIDTLNYITQVSELGRIPCFLCFENKDQLLANIIKAKSFGRASMFIFFSEDNEAMVNGILVEENVVNLASSKES